MSSEQLAQTFASELGALHAKGQELDRQLSQIILAKVNCVRETGQLLAAAKADLSHTEFRKLQQNLPFDEAAVRSYQGFARKHPEPIRELKSAIHAVRTALEITGSLPCPSGHGQQHLHKQSFFAHASSAIVLLVGDYKKFVATRPLSHWHLDELETFQLELRGLSQILSDLAREIARRK